MDCCGLQELSGVQDSSPEELIMDAANKAFIIFSDTSFNRRENERYNHASGWLFAAYIRKHKLGTLYRTSPKLNPNSENMLVCWVWAVDNRALNKHKDMLRRKRG